MPPKAKSTLKSLLFVVSTPASIHSVHASEESANDAILAAKEGGSSFSVTAHELVGGTITVTEDASTEPAHAKQENVTSAPKSAAGTKKTITPAEQRHANIEKGVGKGKPGLEDLPDNIKELLSGSGSTLSGYTVVVTGVPPTIGRKNAEKLVEAYGGKLGKSLSKNTGYVVVGNDAGPKKLEQIKDLNLKTLDEDGLIALLESNASLGGKRDVSGEDEEAAGEKVVEKKTKRQKR